LSLEPYRLGLASLAVIAGITLSGCGEVASNGAVKPAKAEPVAHESELLKLTLTTDAERRLGLQTVAVGSGATRRVRTATGEIIVPPLAGGLPTAAGADLGTLAANQARGDGDVRRARAELDVAQKAYVRADALVREEAGSVRARDEAAAVLGVARSNLATAQAQRALLGTSVVTIGRQSTLWVRVATYAADLESLDRGSAAIVRGLGSGVPARPVNGPPSSNLTAGTVDLYYAFPNSGGVFVVGQRVAVDLPARGASSGIMVPTSALLNDIHGGEWVYVRTKPQTYERRRVEVASISGTQARTTRGLTAGAEVVTAGAAELFGTEFGVK
jgi:hypothetical protein